MNKLERETENACLKVIAKRKGRAAFVLVVEPDGIHPAGANYCIHAENGTKNTEPAPKYNPCRKFRKGDKVRVFAYKGRTPKNHPTDEGYVLKDENDYNTVIVNFGENGRWQINVAYLELVTPVEELEPYSVRESDAFDIVREGKIVMTIPFTEYDYYTFEQARAAAQAECDRLNAEYRKEQP